MKRKTTFFLIIFFMGIIHGGVFAQVNTNGGFENWSDDAPTGWKGSATNAAASNFAKYTDDVYEGLNALQLINATATHKRFSTTSLSVQQARKYAVSFYAKGKGDVRVGLNVASNWSYNNYFNIESSEYILCIDTIECNETSSSAQFLLSFRNTDESMDHLVVDNVFFTIVPEENFVDEPIITIQGESYDETTFFNSAMVNMESEDGNSIYYTLDGSQPTENSILYTEPFEITETSVLNAVVYQNGYNSVVVTKSITIIPGTPLYFENFEESGFDEMITYSDNQEVNWNVQSYSDNSYAYINGHNKGDAITWLVTPSITPINDAGVVLNFKSAKNYSGYPIMVKYSTDYDGIGDPANANWIDITDEFSYSNGSWNWIPSGSLEVEGSMPIRFAWIYTCATGNASAWEIDNILVLPSNNIPLPQIAITAPADGEELSTLDTLPIGIQISNFTLGTDGKLKIESSLLENLGTNYSNPLIIGQQSELDALLSAIITPIPEGEFTVIATLVDNELNNLDPIVSATTSFSVVAPQLPAPIFTPMAGTFADSVTFSLSNTIEGVEIYYTTDGTSPDNTSLLFSDAVTLYETATVKAIAYKENWASSEVTTAEYTIVFEPVLVASAQNLSFTSSEQTKNFIVSGAQLESQITLSCENPHFTISPSIIENPNSNTEITVTFDAVQPTNGVINIVSGELATSVTLSATAKLSTPIFSPEEAISDSNIVVSLSCENSEATIRYTISTEGVEPTSNSIIYTEPIVISEIGTYIIKAMAESEGWENSDIASGIYSIVEPTINDTLIYSIGFEQSEGFEASTTYNNQTVKYTGNEGEQWGTYYGTPATGNSITGGQSMQMRWYNSAEQNLGYTFTNFDLRNVTHVTFKAANSNGLNVKVSHSIDGGTTYSDGEVFSVTSSAKTFDYVVNETGSYDYVRLKFSIVLPATVPSSTSRLVIDEVNVYGILGVTPTTVSVPNITPNSGIYYEPQVVTISCADEDVTIRYTIDGSEPTENSAEYTVPFTVNETTTIKAKAWKENMTPSFVAISTISFPVQVANIASFKQNTSEEVQQIMSDVTFVFRSGSYIFVEDSSAALLIYDNIPSVITSEYNEGDVISAGIFGTYKLYNGMVELIPSHNTAESISSVTITPQPVTVSDIKSHFATIYESKLVRLNGVTFIDSETFVQGDDTMKIRDRFNTLTVTISEGLQADIIGFAAYSNNGGYTIYPRDDNDIIEGVLEKVANPEFSFQLSGEFYFMTIMCETEGADIYYTIDGTDPDINTYHYTSPVPLEPNSYTIKAVALKEGMENSDIVTYNFTGINNFGTTFSIYPNPASDFLMIKSDKVEKITIFNVAGQFIKSVVIEDSHAKIDVSDLSTGTYLLKVKDSKGTFSTTFIKR